MNHFSVIGYGTPSLEDLQTFLNKNLEKTEKKSVGDVILRHLVDGLGGGELFLYFRKNRKMFGVSNDLFCFIPSYKGKTVQNVKKVDLIFSKQCVACVGMNLWIERGNEEYPLIVDLPNYLENKEIDWKAVSQVQITLFPHELHHWKSIEDFKNSDDPIAKLATKSFIPSGTFSINNDPNFIQKAECICSGIVTFVEKKTNGFTGQDFFHLVIDTYAAEYDVVTETSVFKETPAVGSVVCGTFWVCGKVVRT